jgi:hypothetical protein
LSDDPPPHPARASEAATAAISTRLRTRRIPSRIGPDDQLHVRHRAARDNLFAPQIEAIVQQRQRLHACSSRCLVVLVSHERDVERGGDRPASPDALAGARPALLCRARLHQYDGARAGRGRRAARAGRHRRCPAARARTAGTLVGIAGGDQSLSVGGVALRSAARALLADQPAGRRRGVRDGAALVRGADQMAQRRARRRPQGAGSAEWTARRRSGSSFSASA